MKSESMEGIDRKQIQDLLTAVFTLCSLDQTLTARTLDSLIEKGRRSASRKAGQLILDRRDVVDHDALGHVVYIWQRTPRYLGEDGRPIPIPARGPAPSVQALFREVKRTSYFERGLAHLIRVKRIKQLPSKRYVPCSEVTIVKRLTPEMVTLLNQTIHWLVATVLHNTSLRGRKPLRLIERVATVPDLPSKQVRAFKIFAREQGGALLNTVNEWLESRRGPRKARASKGAQNLTAGLHVFAFAEKNRR
jgi:hypothetical protein